MSEFNNKDYVLLWFIHVVATHRHKQTSRSSQNECRDEKENEQQGQQLYA
jgi:hypothetical protein